ncbi:MAG: hypothetical protein H0T18_01180 [Chloroflexia bacterium]|nr:hypothetical protein [Chloroflexia bacterium]
MCCASVLQPQAVYLWESGRRVPQVPQLRKLGALFAMCSDDILLEPVSDRPAAAMHRARADRYPGEAVPGRDAGGRTVTRGREPASNGG